MADGMTTDAMKYQFEKSWIELAKVKLRDYLRLTRMAILNHLCLFYASSKVKAKYFQALSHYHKSFQLETSSKFGENVAHL